jgi:hypothetical protein
MPTTSSWNGHDAVSRVIDAAEAPVFVMGGLTALVGMSRFLGWLTVVPGYLIFDPSGKVLNKALNVQEPHRIAHADASVTIIWGRFLPPWLNTGVVLVGDPRFGEASVGVVQLPGWKRRSLVAALVRPSLAHPPRTSGADGGSADRRASRTRHLGGG